MLHQLDVSVEVVGVGPGRDDLRAVAAHEEQEGQDKEQVDNI